MTLHHLPYLERPEVLDRFRLELTFSDMVGDSDIMACGQSSIIPRVISTFKSVGLGMIFDTEAE